MVQLGFLFFIFAQQKLIFLQGKYFLWLVLQALDSVNASHLFRSPWPQSLDSSCCNLSPHFHQIHSKWGFSHPTNPLLWKPYNADYEQCHLLALERVPLRQLSQRRMNDITSRLVNLLELIVEHVSQKHVVHKTFEKQLLKQKNL